MDGCSNEMNKRRFMVEEVDVRGKSLAKRHAEVAEVFAVVSRPLGQRTDREGEKNG
jgi:hypothetical protein